MNNNELNPVNEILSQIGAGFRGPGMPADAAGETVRRCRTAAELGYPAAMRKLGCCYMNGDGVEVNPTEAVRWFRLAAELGNAVAQRYLALCCAIGLGTDRDDTQAALWRQRAAA